jgi:hypothetical protein
MVLNLRAPKTDGEYLGKQIHVVKTAFSSFDDSQTRANTFRMDFLNFYIKN